MLNSMKPYGARAVAQNPVKYKGAFVLTVANGWAPFWSVWDWTVIKRTVDYCATQGINTLMVTANGIDDAGYAYPSMPQMKIQIAQFCDYALQKGMVVLPQMGYQPAQSFGSNGANLVVNTAITAEIASYFALAQNICMVDAMNEWNYSNPSNWSGPTGASISDMSYFVAAIREAMPGIPVSVSVGNMSVAELTSSWMETIAPIIDIHNIHPYTYNGGTLVLNPSHFSALVSAPWFKGRFVIGETGIPVSGAYTTQQQTDHLASIATVLAMPECIGAVLYGATATNINDFGMLDITGANPRQQIVDGIAPWVGRL